VTSALIGLGANLPSSEGPPEATLRAALARLTAAGLRLAAVSRFYATQAFPPGSGPDFVNAAARIKTARSPAEVLARLHDVEAALGRVRGARWAARAIDLDLLAMGDSVLPDIDTWERWAGLGPEEQLRAQPGVPILPHPRLQDRAFVLVPLKEVAPGWRHPVLGRTVAEMLAALPETERLAPRPL